MDGRTEKGETEFVSGHAKNIRKEDFRNGHIILIRWLPIQVWWKLIAFVVRIEKNCFPLTFTFPINEHRVIQPQCLGGLVTYFTASESELISRNDAYLYAAGIVLCSLISITVFHPFILYAFQLGMRIRLTCCSLIYKKVRNYYLYTRTGKKNIILFPNGWWWRYLCGYNGGKKTCTLWCSHLFQWWIVSRIYKYSQKPSSIMYNIEQRCKTWLRRCVT